MGGGEGIVDHGGGVDAAAARWGGVRADWIDLSTGINPQPYPLPDLPGAAFADLPDAGAEAALVRAARQFWGVPEGAAVLAAPGASALIARLPALRPAGRVRIAGPTYNEHGRAFRAAGWRLVDGAAEAAVVVHPNNPDGRFHDLPQAMFAVIDESFCDIAPERSLMGHAARPGVVVLKSFGKFWGLAGLRLGFAIGDPELVAGLSRLLGPWPVSGPALFVGTSALRDHAWADATRARLTADAARLDGLMARAGAGLVGGTPLFRLYDVGAAQDWQHRLAARQIWTRIFPYSDRWLRLGLPGAEAHWARLAEALAS
jgi:cobalamin biosynthetic protein CobC